MPKLSRERYNQRRANIVTAAKRCFSAHGIHVTVDEICAEAGVSKGTIYIYFRSKEAIIEAIAADHARSIVAFENASDIRTLALLLLEAVDHGDPTSCCLELEAWAHSLHRPQLRDLIRHNFDDLRIAIVSALEAMQRRGELQLTMSPETTAYLLINFVFGIVSSSAFVDDNESARIGTGLDALLNVLITPTPAPQT